MPLNSAQAIVEKRRTESVADARRVLIAGATGAVGTPLVRRLVAAGYDVTGLSRHGGRSSRLASLGARPVVVDALDGDALRRVVADARPDVVVHALTAVPTRGPVWRSDMQATDRLRSEATRHLLDAAIESGAKRFIMESMIFVYGFGDHGSEPITESRPSVQSQRSWLQRSVDALHAAEAMTIEAARSGGIETIILRLGFLYGIEAGWARFVRLLRLRLFPIPGDGSGIGSWIHEEDAAAAFTSAIHAGRNGEAYNVVDDQPVRFGEFVIRLADLTHAPAPIRLPRNAFRVFAPFALASIDSRIPVSNAKARHELKWSPAYPTYREGLAEITARIDAEGHMGGS
jgi:nucleoside-diphosphate-sugar epimerase